jgi:hypothetical protein
VDSRRERTDAVERPPAIVRWTLRLEDATGLDAAVQVVEPTIRSVFGTGARAAVLRGDWVGHPGQRDKRVGLVHAVTNAFAISLYAGSWVARLRGRHGSGARLALAGAAVSGVGGYLGSHLALARKLGSRHPAYGEASLEV